MPRYQHNDISFEPPAGWMDSTVARFHPAPSPVGAPPVPSITMAMERLAPGVSMRTHADQLFVRLAKSVRDFDFLNREETMIGDRTAILLRFQFKASPDAPETMEQTMALVASGTEREPQIVVLAMACPAESAQSSMAVFTNVLRSVRFEEPVVAAAPSSPAPASPSTRPPPPPPSVGFGFGPMPGVRAR
jgi:hypothetical protein